MNFLSFQRPGFPIEKNKKNKKITRWLPSTHQKHRRHRRKINGSLLPQAFPQHLGPSKEERPRLAVAVEPAKSDAM